MPEFRKDPRQLYQSVQLDRIPWLEHGFGTRHSTVWADPDRTVTLKQVHSDVVVHAKTGVGCLGEGDALITDQPGLQLTIRTADCVPIFIVDTERRAIAAIHAGWRGTAASIGAKTVARLEEEFRSRPSDLIVAIGPSIGECCYEVSPEVAERFAEWLPFSAHINLVEANVRQLERAGIPRAQISCARLCTRCGSAEFHSYRRDGDASGRMASTIGIHPECERPNAKGAEL